MNQAKVLIVEDSQIQAEILRRYLVARGFTCTVASDGEAGLFAIRSNRPDLVVSDVQMPVLDGYHMCERIKADPLLQSIPVILLTALSDPVDVIRGLNAGAEAYLTKPYDNERLLVQVNRLLASPPKSEKFESELALEVEIDNSIYSVKAGREQILQMLVSTYDNAAHQNQLLRKLEEDLHALNQQLESKVVERTEALAKEEKRARDAETRYRNLFELLPEGVALVKPDNWSVLEFNDVACGQLGYLREEFINISLLNIAAPEERDALHESLGQAILYPQLSFTTVLNTREGAPLDMEVRTRLIELEGQKLLNCIFRDISEINRAKNMERELEHLSKHDLITDLPGKEIMLEALTQGMHVAEREHAQITLFAIELGRLNTLSASLGHEATDSVLKELADRLRALQPPAQMVARIHNEDFIYMVNGSSDPASLTELLARLVRAINLPFQWNGAVLELDPYIGIGLYPKDAKEPELLLQATEAALYQAKQGGRKGVVLASPELNEQVQHLIHNENELRTAFVNREFEMFFQPRVNLDRGSISGAEALIRWRHPVRGLVPPIDFIPLAEEIGLITPITIWALDQVCHQQKIWLDQGVNIVPVSVNLVAEQFQDNHILEVLEQSLTKYQLPAQYLEVELTESAAMKNPAQTITLLKKIRELGILIAIDDFGTGYSSLSYLEKFPIDILKIDISFVQGVTTDKHAASITSAIIAMAKELNFLIVAEGIEKEDQRQFLTQHHCDEGQGYLFSKPVPAADFEALLLRAASY